MVDYERKRLELLQQENEQLWNMIDTKNKVCSQLCEIVKDLERRLRHIDAI